MVQGTYTSKTKLLTASYLLQISLPVYYQCYHGSKEARTSGWQNEGQASFGPTLFLGSDLFCTVGVPRIAPQVGHLILLQNPSPFQRVSQQ